MSGASQPQFISSVPEKYGPVVTLHVYRSNFRKIREIGLRENAESTHIRKVVRRQVVFTKERVEERDRDDVDRVILWKRKEGTTVSMAHDDTLEPVKTYLAVK